MACSQGTFSDDDSAAPEETPLGMDLANDGRIHAGVAKVDITPFITETFTDLNGDALFDGCLDDPSGAGEGCDEPFEDTDGDGFFDATFIGGFSPLRPASGVHDPIWARALVLSRAGEYLALVSLDLVGLQKPEIEVAREALMARGFSGERLLVASSHNHQGPDVVGLWGNPDPSSDNVISGIDPEYNAMVSQAIEEAVVQAAGSMVPVTARMGSQALRERDRFFNGSAFGGDNIEPTMAGLIHDIRDPLIASDRLFALQLRGDAGDGVATLVVWAGHPEVRGGSNGEISADYVGYLREYLEARDSGMAMFLPEALGGMQSALGGQVPLVDEEGERVWEEGQEGSVPRWAESDSWEFCRSLGFLVGEAALGILAEGTDTDLLPLWSTAERVYIHIDNLAYSLLIPLDIFSLDASAAVTDPKLCPGYDADDPTDFGCVEDQVWRVTLGPAQFLTFPGELLPEVFWGTPDDDPLWTAESENPGLRGSERGSRYFPQHDPACDAVSYEDCQDHLTQGDCDCLHIHDSPYSWSESPGSVDEDGTPPLVDLTTGTFVFPMSMAGDYLSYIIPDNDFNHAVSLLSDNDGDHYEETVSASPTFASTLQAAHLRLWEREQVERKGSPRPSKRH